MKTLFTAMLLASTALWLVGCASLRPDPNVTVTTLFFKNPIHRSDAVSLWARKRSEHTYDIIACGVAELSEEKFLEAWVWMADKLAAGREYEKQTKVEHYEYFDQASDGKGFARREGVKVTGRMDLK